MALAICGCGGGSTSDSIISSSQATLPVRQPSIGRALPSGPVVNGKIQFFDSRGALLGETITNRTGNFKLPDALTGIDNYRAQLEVNGKLLRSEVRGPQVDMLTITPLTTVVSYYMELNPEVSLSEAESRVSRHLLLPNYRISSIIGENPYFSSSRLLAQPDLRALAADVLVGPAIRFDAAPTSSQSLSSKIAPLLRDFSKELGSDYLKNGATDLIGWVANSLGINFLSPSLRDIGNDLSDLESSIESLAQEIEQNQATADFKSDLNALNAGKGTPVYEINSATNTTASTALQNPPVPTGIPISASDLLKTPAGNLVSLLQTNSFVGYVDTIYTYLTATNTSSNIIRDQAAYLLTSRGFEKDDTLLYYSCRCNDVFPPQQNALVSSLLAAAGEGVILVGEADHLSADLAQAIRTAQLYSIKKAVQTQTVLQQVPAPLDSNDVLLDMQFKKMWFLQVQDKSSYGDAVQHCENFTTGPFSQFHMPSNDELSDLFSREKAGNSGNPLQVLINLGFRGLSGDNTVTDSGHHVFQSSDIEVRRFSLDTGRSEGANRDAFLMVRDFPGNAEYDLTINPLSVMTGATLNVVNSSSNGTQTQLKATGTQFRLRAGGPFTVGGKSHSNTQVDALITGNKDVTLQAQWTSSDDSMASVSNDPASAGLVTWHAPLGAIPLGNVTFTARLHDAVNNITLAPPAGLLLTLDSVQISPYNVLYDQSLTDNLDINLQTTIFFKDPLTQDAQTLNGSSFANVTYKVYDTNSHQLVEKTQIDFPTVTPNLMRVFPANTHANVTVNATTTRTDGTTTTTVTGSSPFGFSVLKK